MVMILQLKALFLLLLFLFIARLALILGVLFGQRRTTQTRLALKFSVISTTAIEERRATSAVLIEFTGANERQRLGRGGHKSGRWLRSSWSDSLLGCAACCDSSVMWWQ